MFAEGRAPGTSLNRPIGQDPTLAMGRSRLDAVKGVVHTHDATVNDVLLTSNHRKPIQDSSQGELWSRPARSAA